MNEFLDESLVLDTDPAPKKEPWTFGEVCGAIAMFLGLVWLAATSNVHVLVNAAAALVLCVIALITVCVTISNVCGTIKQLLSRRPRA